MSMRRTAVVAGILLALALVAAPGVVLAQPPAPPGGDRMGGGRQFDPEQMRQRMEEMQERRLEAIGESLEMKDEEWKAVKPLVQKVTDLQRDAMGGGMMMGRMGRRGGGSGPGGERPPWMPEEMEEAKALRECLEKPDADPKDIAAKLEAYRAAVKAKQDALQKARDELRKVLTPKQEAQLVLDSILD